MAILWIETNEYRMWLYITGSLKDEKHDELLQMVENIIRLLTTRIISKKEKNSVEAAFRL